jgi:hypothetical protein
MIVSFKDPRAAAALGFVTRRVAIVAAIGAAAVAAVTVPAYLATSAGGAMDDAPAGLLIVEPVRHDAMVGKIVWRDDAAAEQAAGARLPAVFSALEAQPTPLAMVGAQPRLQPVAVARMQQAPALRAGRAAQRGERSAPAVVAARPLPLQILPYAQLEPALPAEAEREPLLVRVIANPALRAAQAVTSAAGDAGSWTATRASQLLPRW